MAASRLVMQNFMENYEEMPLKTEVTIAILKI